jgi:hypothetical protein
LPLPANAPEILLCRRQPLPAPGNAPDIVLRRRQQLPAPTQWHSTLA